MEKEDVPKRPFSFRVKFIVALLEPASSAHTAARQRPAQEAKPSVKHWGGALGLGNVLSKQQVFQTNFNFAVSFASVILHPGFVTENLSGK